ncbi:hypothetical protein BO71DRAFT_425084 [Aspergillus ellipticus CBS 707.79]|uniref:Uncharacterized protein n=1 Tax=Aspergillus ellipticus CBS 707.79 TaxID=1448320 RepID=A0A319DPQ0_9EURO|nr:hypothetical protein BO71DRAFT_425084 [Aspergillus ellipticus CBS 707.79]
MMASDTEDARNGTGTGTHGSGSSSSSSTAEQHIDGAGRKTTVALARASAPTSHSRPGHQPHSLPIGPGAARGPVIGGGARTSIRIQSSASSGVAAAPNQPSFLAPAALQPRGLAALIPGPNASGDAAMPPLPRSGAEPRS